MSNVFVLGCFLTKSEFMKQLVMFFVEMRRIVVDKGFLW